METTTIKTQKIMSKKETATFCGVSIPTINRWMKDGKLSYIKIGRRVLFSQLQVIDDLQKFIVK